MGSRKHTYSVAIPVLYNRGAQPVGHGPLPGCGLFATGILAWAAGTASCNPILMSGGHRCSQPSLAHTNEAEHAHTCLPLHTKPSPLPLPPTMLNLQPGKVGECCSTIISPHICVTPTLVLFWNLLKIWLFPQTLETDWLWTLLLPVSFSFDWICFSLALNICSSMSFICLWIYCTGS